MSKLKSLSTIPVTVNPHATLNSSKGVISCGELLKESEEKITEELKSQEVIHVRRITIRRVGQVLNTKRLILTFDSNKLPEHIKAGYMRLFVTTYIPKPLRCFKCQRFGHSKTSCRGTLTSARCAEVGHESTDCTRTEKCVKYARKLVKSQTPTPGNSYVSVAKKSASAPSADRNKDISTVSISKPSDYTTRASPPITNLLISSTSSVVPVNEEALASPDFTDFKPVTNAKKLKKNSPTKMNNAIAIAEKISRSYTTSHREVPNSIPRKDNISIHSYPLKPFVTTKPTSVDTELLPMAVLPPLEKALLQSRESDANAEMSSSSLSEKDALELWHHYQRDQNASRRRGSGRRRITTTGDFRYVLQCARRRRALTARQRATQLSSAAERSISPQTVSRRLHEGGLFARRPVVCVPLSPALVRARLHWVREHGSWAPEQWGHVLFTDESRFKIQNDLRRALM
ncbi:hypothetical protein AVEN_105474-1 [Araneus ventricosus]|uniref:Transposase Tc1-like domain-containing protein n=1 Tax=Araneus ventricosus TaxID=182803 RepID=A0A4Y2GIA3_ARAVE|nr:hypothetical protein AVEN_105474-1 [Araneus ventricosus]